MQAQATLERREVAVDAGECGGRERHALAARQTDGDGERR